jgi:hypothetical protein
MSPPDAEDSVLQLAAVHAITAPDPPRRCVVVMFDPAEPPELDALFGDAAPAGDLADRLEAMARRLRDGTLRMPVRPGAYRWDTVPPTCPRACYPLPPQ